MVFLSVPESRYGEGRKIHRSRASPQGAPRLLACPKADLARAHDCVLAHNTHLDSRLPDKVSLFCHSVSVSCSSVSTAFIAALEGGAVGASLGRHVARAPRPRCALLYVQACDFFLCAHHHDLPPLSISTHLACWSFRLEGVENCARRMMRLGNTSAGWLRNEAGGGALRWQHRPRKVSRQCRG